ncbi:MAG: peptidoglycan DD-metalloendopeptidase family protein [Muribaculaceae bacterium]|nr:peptidoglycan DD-metalloendopeptidase family protein [Muribaculaceae bacterium]
MMRKALLWIMMIICSGAIIAAPEPKKQSSKKAKTTKTVKSKKSSTTTKSSKSSSSQTSLSQEKASLQKEIEQANANLKQNQAQAKKQLNQLNLITAEIGDHEKKIKSLDDELSVINAEMELVSDSLAVCEEDFSKVKDRYAKAVRRIQASSSYLDRLTFVFSAPTFKQGYRRIRYLQQFSQWSDRQLAKIRESEERLKAKKAAIEQLASKKQGNLAAQNSTKQSLEHKRQQQQTVVNNLRSEGKALQQVIAEKRKKAQQLDAEINRIIAEQQRKAQEAQKQEEQNRLAAEKRKKEEAVRKAEEARKKEAEAKRLEEELRKKEEAAEARRKEAEQLAQKKQAEKDAAEQARAEKAKREAEEARQKANEAKRLAEEAKRQANEAKQRAEQAKKESEQKPAVSDNVTAAQLAALTGNFENSKGKLPYPVSGKVVAQFGRYTHPDLPHVTLDNGGIDIEAAPGSVAKAVFAGTVSAIYRQDDTNTVVMVRHGNYLTIYVNLTQVFVRNGQQVTAGQQLGKIYSDPDDAHRTILHFEIRNERTRLNPSQWLR